MCAWITLDKPSREHIFLHFLCHRKGISLAARKGFNSSRKYRNDKNILMTHLFCSVSRSCLTLCNPMVCSTPGFPVHHLFPELAQTHVHWVGDANHFILCHPLLFLPSIFPSISVFSNESVLHIRSPKYWRFSFSISPSNEYSGVTCFRIDWLDLLEVQGTLKSFLQYHNLKASILQHSAFLMVQLSHQYMTTGKNHSFEFTALCRQSDVFAF